MDSTGVKMSQYLNTTMQMCIWGLGLSILKLEESKTISGKIKRKQIRISDENNK